MNNKLHVYLNNKRRRNIEYVMNNKELKKD